MTITVRIYIIPDKMCIEENQRHAKYNIGQRSLHIYSFACVVRYCSTLRLLYSDIDKNKYDNDS